MHVLMLLVSSKSSSKCWLDSAAIHEAGGRHGHCDGPCQVGCLIDGTSVSACDHADAAPNQDFARLARYSYRDLGKLEGSPGTPEDDVNMDLFQAKSL